MRNNTDENKQALKLLLYTCAVHVVLCLDLGARKWVIICIVIWNTIFEAKAST